MFTQKSTQMFIAALFYNYEKLKTTQWINKLWYIHTTDYYSANYKIHASIWMNLRDIMLSERSQSQNITYCMIPCTVYNVLVHSGCCTKWLA